MNYASLNEVYGNDFTKKRKKKKEEPPLRTDEMKTEIITRDDMMEFKKRNTPESRVSQVGANPYDPRFNINHSVYGGDNNNNNISDYPVVPNSPFNDPYSMYHYIMNDPDYKDYLIYKKMKKRTSEIYEPFENKLNSELDQLLLYIFTGLFILIMFDSVYKMGINA